MSSNTSRQVTVIIPAYNVGDYIAAALESALAQTLRPADIIVVDDGSTDSTAERVAAVASPLVRYIRQSNQGVSAARNHGLSEATGEFIAFLDADDLWRPTMLEEHVRLLASQENAVFSFSDFERFDHATGQPIGTQFPFYKELESLAVVSVGDNAWLLQDDAFCQLVSFGEFPSFTQTMMFRRSLIESLQFDARLRICEDSHFVLQAATRGEVVFIRKVLTDVRRHGANATADFSSISLDKLTALTMLQPLVSSTRHRAALAARVSRAHFDVCHLFAARKEYQNAFSHWRMALACAAPVGQKLRSSAGLLRRLVPSRPR